MEILPTCSSPYIINGSLQCFVGGLLLFFFLGGIGALLGGKGNNNLDPNYGTPINLGAVIMFGECIIIAIAFYQEMVKFNCW